MKSVYLYPIDVLERGVCAGRVPVQPSLARTMESLVFVRRDIFGHPGPGALLMARCSRIAKTKRSRRCR